MLLQGGRRGKRRAGDLFQKKPHADLSCRSLFCSWLTLSTRVGGPFEVLSKSTDCGRDPIRIIAISSNLFLECGDNPKIQFRLVQYIARFYEFSAVPGDCSVPTFLTGVSIQNCGERITADAINERTSNRDSVMHTTREFKRHLFYDQLKA